MTEQLHATLETELRLSPCDVIQLIFAGKRIAHLPITLSLIANPSAIKKKWVY